MYPTQRTKAEETRRLCVEDQAVMNACRTNPSFLGDEHVLFDILFRNYSVVYDIESLRYVGKITLFEENYSFSNLWQPNPLYGLVASFSNSTKCFSPTSHNKQSLVFHQLHIKLFDRYFSMYFCSSIHHLVKFLV